MIVSVSGPTMDQKSEYLWGSQLGGTLRSQLGAGNVLELDLDGGHTTVYNVKTHPADQALCV